MDLNFTALDRQIEIQDTFSDKIRVSINKLRES